MTWQPELDEPRARERQVRSLGGLDKIEREHRGEWPTVCVPRSGALGSR